MFLAFDKENEGKRRKTQKSVRFFIFFDQFSSVKICWFVYFVKMKGRIEMGKWMDEKDKRIREYVK